MQTPLETTTTNLTKEKKQLCKTEQMMKRIRKMPIFHQLIPKEAGIGWLMPVRKEPVRKENKIHVTVPFYGYVLDPKQSKTILYPPFATITLSWPKLIPVEYVNLRFRNPAPELNWMAQVGTFPHPAVEQITVGEYKEKRHQLLVMYDEMLDNLLEKKAFSPEWKEQFTELFRTLMEPSLEPYYHALAPKFFDRFLPVIYSAL